MPRATQPTDDSSFIASTPVPELLQVIAEKDDLIEQKDHLIAEHTRIIAEQQKLLRLMEEQLRLARQRHFGASSEKLSFQGELFDEAELEVALSDVEAQLPDEAPCKPPRKKREGFSDRLPRIQIHLPLSDEEKAGASKTFFAKVKEELDIIPAKAQIIEYWQEKAVFEQADGESMIKAAARPAHPLGKCMASVQLLAYILVAKYADALPLYRLEQILKRYGGSMQNGRAGSDHGNPLKQIELVAHRRAESSLEARFRRRKRSCKTMCAGLRPDPVTRVFSEPKCGL